jgi:branched-chain amino acid transport system permease protein
MYNLSTHSYGTVKLGGWVLLIGGLAVIPLVLGDSYVFLTADFVIMALFAMSANLLLGQTGMLSFGQAAYYGLGAYTVALLSDKLSIGLIPGIFFAPVVAAVFAAIIGFFCVRLTGLYFGMLTMSFAQLVFTVVFCWYSFTGGDNGLPVMPPDYLLPAANYYYFTLLVVAISVATLWMITMSPFGAALVAIRENPERARFLGINVKAYQLAVFVIAGAFAGIAGALRAPFQQMAHPSLLFWTQSADPIMISLAGGMHTFAGPIVGAAIFVIFNFIISSHFQYPLIAFGILVLLVVLFLPGGVMGFIQERIWRHREVKLAYREVDLEKRE